MSKRRNKIVSEYAKMWPRIVFNIKSGRKLLPELRERLSKPGVYVLYRDDQPYYVGKATRLFSRIRTHANNPKGRYFNFWNYFSAFVVTNKKYLDEVEGVLVASMPTENAAIHRIKRIHLPNKVAKFIKDKGGMSYDDY